MLPRNAGGTTATVDPAEETTPDDQMEPVQSVGIGSHFRTALIAMVIFTLTLGLFSPLVMTGIARIAFPKQAEGSVITGPDGKVIGSELIGQNVDQRLVDANTEGRTFGILGQPRVNVLKLNLALDAQFGKPQVP